MYKGGLNCEYRFENGIYTCIPGSLLVLLILCECPALVSFLLFCFLFFAAVGESRYRHSEGLSKVEPDTV
jgi:hypothetical protein